MNLIPAFIRSRIEHRPNLLKIIDNIGWLFLDKIVRMGIGLFVGVWIARYLGPEQFGLLTFATAFAGLFGAFAGLGLQSLVVRDIVRNPESKEETLGTAAVLQLIGGLLAYGLLLVAIFWLRPNDPIAKALVAILGSMMLFKASEVAIFWFESQVLSKYTVLVQNTVFILFASIKVLLILENAPLIFFAWTMLLETVVVAFSLLAVMDKCGIRLSNFRFSHKRTITLLKDTWPIALAALAVMFNMKIDQIMLGQMIGDNAVGIYGAASRISEVWYFLPTVITASVFPALLNSMKADQILFNSLIQRLFDLMVIISVFIALPMTFLAKPIINILFGEAYFEAATVLSIHIWTSIFVFLSIASGKWFLAKNLQLISLYRFLVGAITNVILNALLIPSYGAVGSAVALFLSTFAYAYLFDLFHKETRHIFFAKTRALNIIGALFRLFHESKVHFIK